MTKEGGLYFNENGADKAGDGASLPSSKVLRI